MCFQRAKIKASVHYLLCLTFLLWSASNLFAQKFDLTLKHYKVQDGLSTPFLESVQQDNDGYIWISHKKGLNRFDGQEFKSFEIPDSFSNLQNSISIIYDNRDHLWLTINHHQFMVFDITSQQFMSPKAFFKSKDLPPIEIKRIYEDIDHIYFLDRQDKIYRYSDNLTMVGRMDEYDHRRSWVSNNSIFQFRPPYLIQHDIASNLTDTIPTTVHYYIKNNTPNKDSWIIEKDKNEIILTKLKEHNIQRTNLSNNGIKDVTITSFGLELAEHPLGLWSLRFNESWYLLDQNFNIKYNLLEIVENKIGKNISGHLRSFVDKTGNLWLATYEGLFLFHIKEQKFKNILNNEPTGSISTRSIFKDSDTLWINSYKGYFKYNIPKNTYTLKSGAPAYQFTRKINNQYYTAFNDHNLAYYKDLTLESPTLIPTDTDQRTWCTDILIDQNNTLWLGTKNGLLIKTENDNTFQKAIDIPDLTIHYLWRESSTIWAATSKGLYHIDIESRQATKIHSIGDVRISHFVKRRDNTFWLAGYKYGLIIWNSETDSIKVIKEKDGLANDYLNAIYEDHNENMWISSDNGLMRMNTQNERINIFREQDGITHNEFNLNSRHRDQDSILYFGGLNGVTIVNPRDFDNWDTQYNPIIMNSIEILHSGKWIEKLPRLNQLTLTPNDQSIKFQFVSIHFTSSEEIKYEYYIDGLDDKWQSLNDNSLRLNALSPGNYELNIRVQGTLNENKYSLPIKVNPPFTQTVWFFAIIALGLFGIYRSRILYLQKQKRTLEETVNRKTKQLRQSEKQLQTAISIKDKLFGLVAHDMRNAILSFRGIQKKASYLLKNNQADRIVEMGTQIDDAVINISDLLDNLITWVKSEQGAMPYRPEIVNVKEITKNAIFRTEGLMASKSITIQNLIPEDLKSYVDPIGLESVLRNIIGNAIKFSNTQSSITIEGEQISAKEIELRIKDEGIGIPSDKLEEIFSLDADKSSRGTRGEKGTGLGLILVKSIVTQNLGQIEIFSSEGSGTECVLKFPI